MSARRRGVNGIRGPQSALTDYLAANNISAHQLRLDYLERQRQVEDEGALGAGDVGEGPSTRVEESDVAEESAEAKRKKRKQAVAIEKIKKSKEFAKRKRTLRGESWDGGEDEIALDMYKKAKPLPGQLENCDSCGKRFTVTPYNKQGPGGGLMCTKCGKEHGAADKKQAAKKKSAANREKRRKFQSDLMDGRNPIGSKSLLELCVELVATNINDVEEFGDLPPALLDRLSQILSKKRVLNSRTLDFFLRADLDSIAIYDCAKLETADFIKIFSFSPKVQNLKLENAGQFKDEVIDYIVERDVPLRSIKLEAPNLVTDEKWKKLFSKIGENLEELKLTWLDSAFDDDVLAHVIESCPNIKYLKLKKCFRLSSASLEKVSELKKLEHLHLLLMVDSEAEELNNLIMSIGPNLRTLCLQRFYNADDGSLRVIRDNCGNLQKLRFTGSDNVTNSGLVDLFVNWKTPPLHSINFADVRDMIHDSHGEGGEKEKGDEQLYGLGSNAFEALMNHSGSTLEQLNLKACRHVTNESLLRIFDGVKQYPMLKNVDLSFVNRLDTIAAAGILKSCPALEKLVLFGCFEVKGLTVPPGVTLIGVPSVQDTIEQEGQFLDAIVNEMTAQ